MKTKLFILLSCVFILALFAAGCGDKTAENNTTSDANTNGVNSAPATSDNTTTSKSSKVIGYVLAGSDIFYQKGFEVFDGLAKDQGWKVFKTTSDYDPKREINNVQDMISKKVDAIVLCTVNSSTGSKAAELANEAGIPIFFITALPDPNGAGQPDGSVSGPWYESGKGIAELASKEHGPDSRIVMIEGAYGQGTPELHRLGFLEQLGKEWSKTPEEVFAQNVVFNQTGGWMTDQAISVMQDAIAKTGGDFDFIFVQNEAMKDGVLKAIQPTGKTYPIYTINGQERTVDQVRDGVVEATFSIPPTTEAEMVFQQVKAKLAGENYPIYLKNVSVAVTKDTVDSPEIRPWLDTKKYLELAKDGKTGIDISSMSDSGDSDPDWSNQAELNGAKSK